MFYMAASDSNKDPIKETILKAALGMMNRFGYGSLNLSDLAREAKITKQRLYYHFPTPEDVLILLAEEWSKTGQALALEALAESHDVGAMKVLAISKGMFDWMRAYPELSRLGLVLYQSSPHIKKLSHFMEQARNAGRARIKSFLVHDAYFKDLKPAKLDTVVTMIHSTMYGSFFYIVATDSYDNIDVQERNCHENLKKILTPEPKSRRS